MKPPIQLISTDFDGTLHAEFETPPVPYDLQEQIAALQQQGAKWVINTGRDLPAVMEGVARARLGIRPDYLVVVERHIYQLDGSHYSGLTRWNRQCELAHSELFAQVRADLPRLVNWISGRFKASLYEDDYSPFCLIADSPENANAIQDYMEEYCRTVPNLAFVRNDVYARLSHTAFNKGTALQEIGRQLGVPASHTFAAGDHLNDLPMLTGQVARCIAAPDNAVPQVKDVVRSQGGYVSHQPWGHGVARALEFFLEKEIPNPDPGTPPFG